jgi:iron-sulfur cluster repair protein YtfE (RIC family)
LDPRGNSGSCFGASLFDVAPPRSLFGHLLRRDTHNDFLVAPRFSSFYKFRIFETMSNAIDTLLEDDHQSLDQLLAELDEQLAKPNLTRAFELLDLFWARLAVHIRAENLHLFPAIINASASLLPGKGGLPKPEEAQGLILRLRSDHDFFMKELAQIIKAGREIVAVQTPSIAEFEKLRPRLTVIRTRLETHNRLEEDKLYTWPALLFDKTTLADLRQCLQHELENLPPRFA